MSMNSELATGQPDTESLSFSLLITGQIRNVDTFRSIAQSTERYRHLFNKLIYSTWQYEIIKFKDTIYSYPSIEVLCAGEPLPVQFTRNRNITGFLAQHQQFCAGFRRIPHHDLIVRVRADDQSFSSIQMDYMLQFVQDFVRKKRSGGGQIPTFVRAISHYYPFFLDDRFTIYSPSHWQALRDINLSLLYDVNIHNIFPEFIFYFCKVWNERPSMRPFLSADLRETKLRHCSPDQLLRKYFQPEDISKFWQEYRDVLATEFALFEEALDHASEVSTDDIRGVIIGMRESLSGPFAKFSKSGILQAFKERSERAGDIYRDEPALVPETSNRDPNIAINLYWEDEYTYLSFETLLHEKRYDEVLDLLKTLPERMYMSSFIRECEGIAHFYKGELEMAKICLTDSYNRGGPSVWTLYYLLCIVHRMELVEARRKYAAELMQHHSQNVVFRRHAIGTLIEANDYEYACQVFKLSAIKDESDSTVISMIELAKKQAKDQLE